jgi:release factor glutamine methyltransferase
MGSNRSIKKVISKIKSELKDIYPDYEIEGFIRLIFEYVLDYSIAQIHLNQEKDISVEKLNNINQIIDDLKIQRPIQYIFGETEFYDLRFKVNPSVLIPRQETEELVDLIIKQNKKDGVKILDIGTGSGCIAISLAKNIKNSKVTAIDVSENALQVVTKNSLLNKVKIETLQQDILKAPKFDRKFDIIVSNPPYVTDSEKELMNKNVLDNEPHLALFVPNSEPLKFYESITSFAKDHLNKDGKLYFEINESFGKETAALLKENEFLNILVLKDLNGKDRIVVGDF